MPYVLDIGSLPHSSGNDVIIAEIYPDYYSHGWLYADNTTYLSAEDSTLTIPGHLLAPGTVWLVDIDIWLDENYTQSANRDLVGFSGQHLPKTYSLEVSSYLPAAQSSVAEALDAPGLIFRAFGVDARQSDSAEDWLALPSVDDNLVSWGWQDDFVGKLEYMVQGPGTLSIDAQRLSNTFNLIDMALVEAAGAEDVIQSIGAWNIPFGSPETFTFNVPDGRYRFSAETESWYQSCLKLDHFRFEPEGDHIDLAMPGAEHLSDGWSHWSWWGWAYSSFYPFLYDPEQGWLYMVHVGDGALYCYAYATEGWLFISQVNYPWVYNFTAQLWEQWQ